MDIQEFENIVLLAAEIKINNNAIIYSWKHNLEKKCFEFYDKFVDIKHRVYDESLISNNYYIKENMMFVPKLEGSVHRRYILMIVDGIKLELLGDEVDCKIIFKELDKSNNDKYVENTIKLVNDMQLSGRMMKDKIEYYEKRYKDEESKTDVRFRPPFKIGDIVCFKNRKTHSNVVSAVWEDFGVWKVWFDHLWHDYTANNHKVWIDAEELMLTPDFMDVFKEKSTDTEKLKEFKVDDIVCRNGCETLGNDYRVIRTGTKKGRQVIKLEGITEHNKYLDSVTWYESRYFTYAPRIFAPKLKA